MSFTKGPATSYLHSITNGETGLKPLAWNTAPVCATEGCNSASSGKSKYCRVHAREARAAWIDKVRASAEARAERVKSHAALWARAIEAARKAHNECDPTPMVVRDAQLDGTLPPNGKTYYVSEGACGFGWVKVMPANSSFALWLTANGHARKAYGGGVSISTNFGGSQSIARAEAAAWALSDVLREAGIKAYADSRLD